MLLSLVACGLTVAARDLIGTLDVPLVAAAFFDNGPEITRGRGRIGDECIFLDERVRHISIQKDSNGRGSIDPDRVAGNLEISVSFAATDHHAPFSGMNDLVVEDAYSVVVPTINIEAVDGVAGDIVVERHVATRPRAIANVITMDLVVAHFSDGVGEGNSRASASALVSQGDVFNNVAGVDRWRLVIHGDDPDRKDLAQFSSRMNHFDTVDPVASRIRPQMDRIEIKAFDPLARGNRFERRIIVVNGEV